MNIIKLFLLFLMLFCFFPFVSGQEKKINGMSMVASRSLIDQNQAKELKQTGSNFIAVMPYAFMPKADTPQLFFDNEQQWNGETLGGIESDIQTLKTQGLKIMVKPHIWVGSGTFTGKIAMSSEAHWKAFESQYKQYILAFAQLAEENDVELFCLGTELNSFAIQRKDFWCDFITEVSTVYSGKLTYAENWDSYDNVGFWDSLDFIGIDAYFPISEERTPSTKNIKSSWFVLKRDLKAFSQSLQTKILLTEYGYRSMDYAGKQPWDSSREERPVNQTAQLNLLKGLHESLWDEGWFAGGFLWKWFPNFNESGKRHQNRFTVQGKRSESYLKSFYSRK
ncbi:glycoside hydrolase family 113 [Psychroflexus tropicus]|uniref:glycoside hydrolase family 113 n=1 Tax=Psychroflexus tropicus TaxID=197345 RepID=UPI001FE14552|nr:glycoside hydrolase [Psychroflexus tropicus]